MQNYSNLNNMCAYLRFCKEKVLLIILLQVNIKDLSFNYFQCSNPRFEHIKNEKLSRKMFFFSAKRLWYSYQQPFVVYKIKILKRWQIPLRDQNQLSELVYVNLYLIHYFDQYGDFRL